MVPDEYRSELLRTKRQIALKHHQGDIFGAKNQTNSRQGTQLEMQNRTSHTSHEITVRLQLSSLANIVLFKRYTNSKCSTALLQ